MGKILSNSTFKTVTITLFIALLCRFTFLIYIVNGESMYPTLHDKQFGIALRTTVTDINRYDIVVIKQTDKYLIKRVIGLPGEKVEYKNNKLYINGELTEDQFDYLTEDYSVQVGNDEYFCLGDNRQNSADSRLFGCFNKKFIKASKKGE